MTTETKNAPEILSKKAFGPAGRYRLVEFRTRFGTTAWHVTDAEAPTRTAADPAPIIRQAATAAEAVRGLATD